MRKLIHPQWLLFSSPSYFIIPTQIRHLCCHNRNIFKLVKHRVASPYFGVAHLIYLINVYIPLFQFANRVQFRYIQVPTGCVDLVTIGGVCIALLEEPRFSRKVFFGFVTTYPCLIHLGAHAKKDICIATLPWVMVAHRTFEIRFGRIRHASFLGFNLQTHSAGGL